MMDANDLVEKLHKMREAGRDQVPSRETMMMHLFGAIFDRDIAVAGTNATDLVRRYEKRYGHRIGAPNVSDGRNLREVMNIAPDVERRWRDGAA